MTATIRERLQRATQAENRIEGLLKWWDKNYYATGQECWLPQWAHSRLRFQNDEQPITVLRHFPDLATDRVFIQIKDASNSNGYPTLTMEEASYNASCYLMEHELPVLCVWWCYVGEKLGLYGNWADELAVREPSTPRQEANGSHTPYLLIEKSSLKPIQDFREAL